VFFRTWRTVRSQSEQDEHDCQVPTFAALGGGEFESTEVKNEAVHSPRAIGQSRNGLNLRADWFKIAPVVALAAS
jgi:hypothetical protein